MKTNQILMFALSLTLTACAAQDDSSGGSGNVGFGGAQDIGQFRGILEQGEIPGSATLDANGFFSEHYNELPAAECGTPLCLHGMVSVNRNWLDDQYQAVLQVALNTAIDPADLGDKPMDLVVVVDTSGSMVSDNRLNYVVTGLEFLIDNLDSDDRMGIVSYSSDSVTHIRLTDNQDHENLKSVVRGFVAEGGTNIYSGLEHGMQMAAEEFSSERRSRVILLSDGNVTVGREAPQILSLSEVYVAEGIGLTTIGVGSDFNVGLMRGLAERGSGNFYFLEDPSAVAEVFTEELEYFSEPIALGLNVEVVSHDSHTFGETVGTSLWETSGNTGSMSIPAVFLSSRVSEEPGEFGRRGGGSSLFIEMKPTESDFSGDTMATVRVSYHLPGSSELIVQEIEVNNPFRSAPPEEGYLSHIEMLNAYAMYNVFLGLRQATLESETDYHCAASTLAALDAVTRDWNARVPSDDIEADLLLISMFRSNLTAKGGDADFCGEPYGPNDEVYYEDDIRYCSVGTDSPSGAGFMLLILMAGLIGFRRRGVQ